MECPLQVILFIWGRFQGEKNNAYSSPPIWTPKGVSAITGPSLTQGLRVRIPAAPVPPAGWLTHPQRARDATTACKCIGFCSLKKEIAPFSGSQLEIPSCLITQLKTSVAHVKSALQCTMHRINDIDPRSAAHSSTLSSSWSREGLYED